MKRIYLAGPFSWRERIKAHAVELESLGYQITGKWLDQTATFTNPDNTTITKKPGLHADCERLSVRDLADIAEADTLVLFEPGIAIERNTRVAEFGAALAWGLQCVVIQPPDEDKKDVISNIFVKLQHWDEFPSSWAFNPRLGNIKPVKEYHSWQNFYTDIANKGRVSA